MKTAFYYLLVGYAATATLACKSDKGQGLPPEEVIRQYQSFIDLNRFDDAKKLSTPAEQKRLDEEATLIAMLPADSTVLHTVFHKIQCREINNHLVVCDCLLEDEEAGEYEATFHLVKAHGTWLIDFPHFDEEEPVAPAAQPQSKPMALPQKL